MVATQYEIYFTLIIYQFRNQQYAPSIISRATSFTLTIKPFSEFNCSRLFYLFIFRLKST